jgi:hypothetical protein
LILATINDKIKIGVYTSVAIVVVLYICHEINYWFKGINNIQDDFEYLYNIIPTIDIGRFTTFWVIIMILSISFLIGFFLLKIYLLYSLKIKMLVNSYRAKIQKSNIKIRYFFNPIN